ncbi:aquaporin-like protein [Acrodontium crateriforme]|uniref:Aquaporin-like protein n=1 Tax=Acrodontium crateriforme TaxID=150365 RepID=A0AAQ3R9X4_9PEZI|nr:aquaporin-like protein [Acrodontium crateriforme]
MNTDATTDPERHRRINRLFRHFPKSAKGHVVAVLREFSGTFFFLFFAFAGVQTANVSSNTNTGTTGISGGLFNPAVTSGMALIRAITPARAALLFLAQMLGAILAAYVVQALFTGELNVSTTLSETTINAQGVIIEMLLTAQLVFTIFMLAAEKHVGNFIAPIGIGLSLFISELSVKVPCVFWTGGSLNPARSFAPAVAIAKFSSDQWVYWVGPLAGSVLAVGLYDMIKILEFETTNGEHSAELPSQMDSRP